MRCMNSPMYLKGVLTSSPTPSNNQAWQDPAVQQCSRVVHKALPADKITPSTNPMTSSDQSFFSVESACTNLALFAAIATAAGKNLTTSSFARAEYGSTAPGSLDRVAPFRSGRTVPTQSGSCTW